MTSSKGWRCDDRSKDRLGEGGSVPYFIKLIDCLPKDLQALRLTLEYEVHVSKKFVLGYWQNAYSSSKRVGSKAPGPMLVIRHVSLLKPRILENARKARTLAKHDWQDFNGIVHKALDDAGYRADVWMLNTAPYGHGRTWVRVGKEIVGPWLGAVLQQPSQLPSTTPRRAKRLGGSRP